MWTELKFMENVWQLQTEFQLTIKSVPPICYDLEINSRGLFAYINK